MLPIWCQNKHFIDSHQIIFSLPWPGKKKVSEIENCMFDFEHFMAFKRYGFEGNILNDKYLYSKAFFLLFNGIICS